MSNETVAPSSASAQVGGNDAVETSGNVSVGQVARELLKRSQPQAPETPVAEHATPPKETGTPPATAGETISPTEGKAAEVVAPQAATEATDPDDVLSTESSPLDPKLQAKIDKKIAKEVAKREALRIENEALKERLNAQGQQPNNQNQPIIPAAALDQPLSHVSDVQSLVREQTNAKEVKRWAEAQLDRDDIANGVQLGEKTYTKQELKAMVRNASVLIEDQIPQRYQFLQARQQAEQQAIDAFPWMKDRSSPEYMAMQQAYRQYPWLNNLPDAPLVVGRQILGAQAYEKMVADKKSGSTAAPVITPKPTPPASQTAVGGQTGQIRVPQGTQAAQKLQAKVEEMKKKGNVSRSDVAKILQMKESIHSR